MMKYWKSIVPALTFSLLTGGLAMADAPAAPSTAPIGQHAATFEKHIVIKLDYLLSLPADYEKEAAKKWPLILFLHGSGERGTDVSVVKKHGPPKIVESDPASPLATQFIVVSPQCPEGQWWKSDDLALLLDDVEAKYHVDLDRVYLTGLSMGGYGTWEMSLEFPDRFAAIAPMCGGGRPDRAKRLRNLPIWVFHGTADRAVPVARSEEMVAALAEVGADVKFTRYEGVGHDCWTQSYGNPELYTWFLEHKRGEKSLTKSATEKPAKTVTPKPADSEKPAPNK